MRGQGVCGLVDPGHPPGGGHDPLAVVHAAHIRLVDELAAAGEPGIDGGIDLGRLHLPEVGGNHAEGHHELGDILVGGQAQGGLGGIQHIVLLGTQVVVHGTVVGVEVGLVDHLIIPWHVVGAGNNLVQPHRLAGQGIAPINEVRLVVELLAMPLKS